MSETAASSIHCIELQPESDSLLQCGPCTDSLPLTLTCTKEKPSELLNHQSQRWMLIKTLPLDMEAAEGLGSQTRLFSSKTHTHTIENIDEA